MSSSSGGGGAAAAAAATDEIQADADADDICSICLDKINKPIKLPCDHEFCISCIEKWRSKYVASSQRTCPHCRASLPPTAEMVSQLQMMKLTCTMIQGRLNNQSMLCFEDPFVKYVGHHLEEIRSVDDPVLQKALLRNALHSMLKDLQTKVEQQQQIIGDAEMLLDQEDESVEDLPKAIAFAATGNNVEMVLNWLGRSPVPYKRINAKCRDFMDFTLLHDAVQKGNLWLMQLLLQLGAKVDPRCVFGNTPFDNACVKPELEDAARLLLAWGAVKDRPDTDGSLPHENARKYARNNDLANLLQSPLGGRRFEIIGLKNCIDLNGKTGIATKYLAAEERYAVQLEHNNRFVSVRPVNLRRRDRTPSDCGIYVRYDGRGPDNEPRFVEGLFVASEKKADGVVEEEEGST